MQIYRIILFFSAIVFAVSCGQTKVNNRSDKTITIPADAATEADDTTKTAEATFHVQGMTCSACAASVKGEISKLAGISNVEVRLPDSIAIVRFNPSLANEKQIIQAIKKRGYKVKPEVAE